ncbi:MAG: aminotransferase class I/II-fold pyridoxal phosphate-dependent enzyme [Clostridia bacterium]|nr:aminotransferase class I/II-fold pyridoxal phosphate-dependent enzyme [Clostridia bacterium]
MLYFQSDYVMGAHPDILSRLASTNFEATAGYGQDQFSDSAKHKIKEACACPEADVWFLVGGTQTNAIVISTMLQRYESVIAAQTGHIAAHEAGAVEYTGHKIISLPHHQGKLDADEVDTYVTTFFADANHEHMAPPAMVYISHPTEYGTLYSKDELCHLAAVCKKHGMALFMDGARLGYGLMSRQSDLTLPDIARLCDVFYIGGTKVGALCGEAVVFTKNNTPKHFLTQIKQQGALIAKGRLLGVQFDALFTDNLYFKISKNAIDKAERLKEMLISKGYRLFMDSPTNQQFVIMENSRLARLSQEVSLGFWEKYDENHTVVRFATSWATTSRELDELEALL